MSSVVRWGAQAAKWAYLAGLVVHALFVLVTNPDATRTAMGIFWIIAWPLWVAVDVYSYMRR